MGNGGDGGRDGATGDGAGQSIRYEYRKVTLSTVGEGQADKIIAFMAREGWEWLSSTCADSNRSTAAKVTCIFRRGRCS